MKYVGLQSQIWKNNAKSILLLIMFPLVFYLLALIFFYFIADSEYRSVPTAFYQFLRAMPWITIVVGLWFIIAYFSHSSMINKATGSKPLERKENKRVYNIVENLCIAAGMTMPKVNVIEDDSLNAFASGLNRKNFTVSLSRGIIDKLNDEELEGVVAHELTHIRNRDVRLLIISIVFVGIFAFISETLMRSMVYGRGGRGKKDNKAQILILLLALVGLLLATLFRFALSQKREYLADAGSAELTKKPWALASALEKVSQDPTIEAVKRKDVAQMFIDNPQLKKKKKGLGLFATHPPIEKRIEILRQF